MTGKNHRFVWYYSFVDWSIIEIVTGRQSSKCNFGNCQCCSTRHISKFSATTYKIKFIIIVYIPQSIFVPNIILIFLLFIINPCIQSISSFRFLRYEVQWIYIGLYIVHLYWLIYANILHLLHTFIQEIYLISTITVIHSFHAYNEYL